jgi:hypothetical protein
MKLGLALPYDDTGVSVGAIRRLSQEAESLDYDSVWALERDVFPSARPLPAVADASSRDVIRDPLSALAFAAAGTERINLGLGLLNVPFHSPVTLATNLASLNRLSNGRVQLGVGIGYSESECQAVTSTLERRTPASEFIEAFDSLWGGSTSGYQGHYFFIPKGVVTPGAGQYASPPVSLVAFAPAAVLPSMTLVSGSVEVEPKCPDSEVLKGVAQCRTTRPIRAQVTPLAVRARVIITAEPIGAGRAMFHGSPSQVKSDIAVAGAYGVNELLIDPGDMGGDADLMWTLAMMRMVRDLAPSTPDPVLVASV